MTTHTSNYFDLASRLPANTVVAFHNVGWDEYEELLLQVGESSGMRISFDNGSLQIMTTSPEHERYASFIERLVSTLSLQLRINILFFGSATIKKRGNRKGNEPDCCFYVQTATAIGNRMHLDFEVDPPPDIAVEVDLHHDSRPKFPIYAGLGLPEIWRFDGIKLTIYLLEDDHYRESATSVALPMLTSVILTDFLSRLSHDNDLEILLAFDEWLKSLSR